MCLCYQASYPGVAYAQGTGTDIPCSPCGRSQESDGTALIIAAERGHYEVVMALLNHGANVEHRVSTAHASCYRTAVKVKDSEHVAPLAVLMNAIGTVVVVSV